MTFKDFNLDSKLHNGLLSMGYTKPTPIQEQAIPVILQGRDVIACAQTGTGKTAAYILPVIHKIINSDFRHLNTLVIAPTRELAQQIDQQIEGFSYYTGISSIPIFGGGGGEAWETQRKALERGTDIIVATPGRLISLLATGTIVFDHLKHLILDEADRMLDMGFFDDIVKIIKHLPNQRQTLLFSATMPPKIRVLANKILNNPLKIDISIAKPAEGILQQVYLLSDSQKLPLINYLFQSNQWDSVLIFASTKSIVKKLGSLLNKKGLSSEAFHSDLEQRERETILQAFKSKQLKILIGTDVLSRGIDVDGINAVINFDAPLDPEDYVHRVGRTARAENTGVAITFVNEKDQLKLFNIEELIGDSITKVPLPQSIGRSPIYDPKAKRISSPHSEPKQKTLYRKPKK